MLLGIRALVLESSRNPIKTGLLGVIKLPIFVWVGHIMTRVYLVFVFYWSNRDFNLYSIILKQQTEKEKPNERQEKLWEFFWKGIVCWRHRLVRVRGSGQRRQKLGSWQDTWSGTQPSQRPSLHCWPWKAFVSLWKEPGSMTWFMWCIHCVTIECYHFQFWPPSWWSKTVSIIAWTIGSAAVCAMH